MQLILLLFLSCILPATTQAIPWNCTSSSGNFTIAGACTMCNEVILTGDLTIVGINSSGLITIKAADKSRHFRMISSYDNVLSLTLRNLNLTGGFPFKSEIVMGGSIYSDGDNTLTVSNCVFRSNKAISGGAIFFMGRENGARTISITDSKFINNKAFLEGDSLQHLALSDAGQVSGHEQTYYFLDGGRTIEKIFSSRRHGRSNSCHAFSGL